MNTKSASILSCLVIFAGICLTAAFLQRKGKPVKLGNVVPIESFDWVG